MKKYSKLMAILLVFAMILAGVAQAAPVVEAEEVNSNVIRLSGADRIKTSVKISQTAYKDGAESVVIVGYEGEVDALAGTLLAHAKKGPVLFTKKGKLSEDTKTEIARLGAKNVYILGGTATIEDAVKTELETLKYTVKRISGSNREGTAAAVAKEVGGKTTHVFLARGYGDLRAVLSDALAVGPASAKGNMAVLLTRTDKVPAATLKSMKDLGVTNVTIVGGEVAVNSGVKTELETLKYTVDRLSGTTREGTAIAIANKYFAGKANALVANGYGSPDALVGGYLGAAIDAPILFSQANKVSEVTTDYLKANTEKAWILGGERVVNKEVLNKVLGAVVPTPTPPSTGGGSGGGSGDNVAVNTISVEGEGGATTIDTDNGTLQMIADVTPANASNKSVTWSVENGTGSATISSTGLLTAVADGTVTVKATAKDGSGVIGTTTITISNQEAAADVDTTEYDAIVATVPANNDAGTYTADSWTAFAKAIAECDLKLTEADGQAALDAEVIAIQEALDLLKEVTYVAQIGEVKYETLAEAVAAVEDNTTATIKLLADADGSGIFLAANEGKNITIDFGGKTYTITSGPVGSTGYETQGLHLEKGNTVTLKNGTITSSADSGVKMLVQKYCDLTLENMVLDGTKLSGSKTHYVLSNNNGTTTLTGKTKITAAKGDVAFDVYYWPGNGYESVTVEIASNDVAITGRVEYASDGGEGFATNAKLIIPADYELTAPAGYKWVALGEDKQVLEAITYVAQIGDVKYESLQKAVDAVEANGTITLLADASGDGVIVPENSSFTLDLNGKTYTVDGTLVGSTGTETNGFQLLKDSTITIKNGKITTPNVTGAKILIQNYSNLTLDDVELVGADVTQYVLSNNFGDTTLENGTKITAATGKFAFDVYYGLSAAYDAGVSVTIADTNVVINGAYEYGKAGRVTDENWYEKATLIIAKDHTLEALDGYKWVTNTEGNLVLTKPKTVAEEPIIDATTDLNAYFKKGNLEVGFTFRGEGTGPEYANYQIKDLDSIVVSIFNGEKLLAENSMQMDKISDTVKNHWGEVSIFVFGRTPNNQWSWDYSAYPLVGDSVSQEDLPTRLVLTYKYKGDAYRVVKDVNLNIEDCKFKG